VKKPIKRIAQKSNRKLRELAGQMKVNLMLPIAEILRRTQWHIEQLAGAAGMKIIQQIIQDDVRQLADEHRYARDGKDGQLWGSQPGWVAFGGRKVTVDTPGIRSKATGPELRLEKYERLQDGPSLDQAMMDQIALGLSKAQLRAFDRGAVRWLRDQEKQRQPAFHSGEPARTGRSTGPPTVGPDIGAVFLDGIHRGGHCVIVALGVTRDGGKALPGTLAGSHQE
jgi:hypothetical protein